jgi:putative transposase
MIDAGHELPIARPARRSKSRVLRSTGCRSRRRRQIWRRCVGVQPAAPEASVRGSRVLRDVLRLHGHEVGRKHVVKLMRKMAIQALYRKAITSMRYAAHLTYPYLLRGLTIERPNQM